MLILVTLHVCVRHSCVHNGAVVTALPINYTWCYRENCASQSPPPPHERPSQKTLSPLSLPKGHGKWDKKTIKAHTSKRLGGEWRGHSRHAHLMSAWKAGRAPMDIVNAVSCSVPVAVIFALMSSA